EIERDFELLGLRIRSFYVMPGSLPVLAYRFDEPGEGGRAIAYVTDVNYIPPDSLNLMRGLDVLLLDAGRFEPHSTHFGLYQAVEVVEQVDPKRAYLTHI